MWSSAVGLEMCWRRRTIAVVSLPTVLVLILIPVTRASAVVVAVVHPQRPAHDLELVQIPHGGGRGVDIGVFEEAEAFGSASLFVVHEAEVDDLADAAEDVADLFFADACRKSINVRNSVLAGTLKEGGKVVMSGKVPYGMFPMKTTRPPFSLFCAILTLLCLEGEVRRLVERLNVHELVLNRLKS